MKRNLALARLPIFACAGLILSLFVVNLWNDAVGRDWPKLRIRSAQPLWGVPGPKPVPWTLDAFLDGETQKAFSNAIGQTMPVFPLAVRAKNQFLYSVFGASGAPNIVVGKDRQLFEDFYVREFCGRSAAPDAKKIDVWADRIRNIQTSVEAGGKNFVYLVSPSKAARYSRYFPARLSCASVSTGTTEKLAPHLAALSARGVNYVDGASLISAVAPQYPIDLFPRGGTHWNYLGSAIATRELTRALNKDGKTPPLPLYDFNWSPRGEALGTDRDLVNLLNLIWPDANYPTAAVTGKSAGDCGAPPKLFAVGGSFLVEIVTNLTEAPCGAAVDYWHYVHNATEPLGRFVVAKEGGVSQFREQPSKTSADFAKAYENAQIVLLEENESVIADMAQVPDLLAAAAK
ncbi:alginate O-acetyltransferase AlgX-related protein [Methylocystis parvus]|uniref:alginate O-acetyltransferase AlgX-related protein n=1 Tax=Methylocystis parvus TaxID=134 RepID=UPI003C76E528